MATPEIRNIIFDLGKVLMGVEVERSLEKMKALGIRMPANDSTREEFMKMLVLFETGQITPEGFRSRMREYSDKDFEDQDFDLAWGAMLTEYYPGTIDAIIGLQGHYRLMLLSNTNALHVPYFIDQLIRQHGLDKMESLFEKVYYSHELGMRKPDREIYEFVLRDAGIVAGETLFIDDREENILAARELGILGHHLVDGEAVPGILKTYSLI